MDPSAEYFARSAITAVMAAAAAGAAVFHLSDQAESRSQRGRVRRLLEVEVSSAGGSARVNNVQRRLSRLVTGTSWGTRVTDALAEADIHVELSVAAGWLGVAGAVVAATLLIVLHQPLVAVVGGLGLPPVLSFTYVGRRRARKREQLVVQLPGALMLLSNALKAGRTLRQAVEEAADQLPFPIQGIMQQARDAYRLGRSLEDVLDDAGRRIRVPAFDVVIAAILVQQVTGGDLAKVLADAAELIQDSYRLRRDLRVATAHPRLSAQVVGGLPVLLAGVLFLLSPDSLAPFFDSPLGVLLFLAAGILDLVGFMLVARASHVDF